MISYQARPVLHANMNTIMTIEREVQSLNICGWGRVVRWQNKMDLG